MERRVDLLIKLGLFLLTPWALNLLVDKATGASLFESLLWQFRHLESVQKPLLFFGILAALVVSGFAYGVFSSLYQTLISRQESALFLGYHDLQEHYLGGDTATPRSVAIFHPGPGPERFDRVYQTASVMFNRFSGHYWALQDIHRSPWSLAIALVMLLFALPALGHGHVLFLETMRPDVLHDWLMGPVGERQYAKVFAKALLDYLATHPAPIAIVMIPLLAALGFQSLLLRGADQLATTIVPAAIRPGGVLTATLVDTYQQSVPATGSSSSQYNDSTRRNFYYFAIFEFKGLYPHPVWLAARLGSDKTSDKNDGNYLESDSTLTKRVDFESATALYESLTQKKALRPTFQVGVTQDLTLDWTVDPNFK
jgi:hypothetical protein